VGRVAASLPVIKAIRVRGAGDIAGARAYRRASLLLFDAYEVARLGGTGKRFPWSLLRRHRPGTPFLLAGGLTPANVAAAVRAVRPYGVDVASGVESAPRRKDRRKVMRFIRAAKGV
jgi:phosphoribosylanthranilate isomerase